jgi:tetratricopeptide (TPR) repeat protein
MAKKEEIQLQIDSLGNKAWQSEGEEKRARLHELIMLHEQLLETSKNDDPYFIYDQLARIHAYLKETKKAETYLQKMIQLAPKSNTAWWLLTEVLFESQQYKEALVSIDTCIANTFGADYRYEMRAKINRALGNLDESEKDQKIYDAYQAAEQAKWDDPNHYYHYK